VGSLSRYERSSTVRTDLTPYVPLFFGAGVSGTAERRVAPLTVKATTAELRLVSNGDQRLNWTPAPTSRTMRASRRVPA